MNIVYRAFYIGARKKTEMSATATVKNVEPQTTSMHKSNIQELLFSVVLGQCANLSFSTLVPFDMVSLSSDLRAENPSLWLYPWVTTGEHFPSTELTSALAQAAEENPDFAALPITRLTPYMPLTPFLSNGPGDFDPIISTFDTAHRTTGGTK